MRSPSYKLVAIATDGRRSVRHRQHRRSAPSQDLSIYSGLPPLVRSGDEYGATFTLRNGTDKPMTVTATADGRAGRSRPAQPLTVTIPAGGAVPVTWRLTAPEGVDKLRWTVSAQIRRRQGDRPDHGRRRRSCRRCPVETWAATFAAGRRDTPFPVAPPAGALPGRGGVDVALDRHARRRRWPGVRAYMAGLSLWLLRAAPVARRSRSSDRGGLDQADRASCRPIIDADGLLRYWPDDSMPGSDRADRLCAVDHRRGRAADGPTRRKAKLIEAMKAVVDGRLREQGEGPCDMRLLRIAALAALARNGAATPAMLGQTAIPLADMPTATLADWMVDARQDAGRQRRARAPRPRPRCAAASSTKARGSTWSTRAGAPWWMMVSDDEMAIKALLAVHRPAAAGRTMRRG